MLVSSTPTGSCRTKTLHVSRRTGHTTRATLSAAHLLHQRISHLVSRAELVHKALPAAVEQEGAAATQLLRREPLGASDGGGGRQRWHQSDSARPCSSLTQSASGREHGARQEQKPDNPDTHPGGQHASPPPWCLPAGQQGQQIQSGGPARAPCPRALPRGSVQASGHRLRQQPTQAQPAQAACVGGVPAINGT